MSATTADVTPIDEAEGTVRAARELRDQWQQRHNDASEELRDLDSNLGTLLLNDPGQEEELVVRQLRLRGRIAAAEEAIRAQAPIVLAAELAFIRAVADAEQVELDAKEAAVITHRVTVETLLAKLEELDGQGYVSKYDHVHAQIRAGILYEGSIKVPKSQILANDANVVRRRVQALRALAAGQPLQPLLSGWGLAAAQVLPPAVYGPTAVVVAPEWEASVERAKVNLADLEELAKRLPAEISA